MTDESVSWAEALGVGGSLAIVIAGAGVLVREVAVRTADGRWGRNSVAGIRTKATQSSDAAWLAAHEAGERTSRLGGVVAIVAGLSALMLGPALAVGGGSPEHYFVAAMTIIGVGVALMALLVVAGAVSGHRAAALVRSSQKP